MGLISRFTKGTPSFEEIQTAQAELLRERGVANELDRVPTPEQVEPAEAVEPAQAAEAAEAPLLEERFDFDSVLLFVDRLVIKRSLKTRALHPTWPGELEIAYRDLRKVEIFPPVWTSGHGRVGFIRLGVAYPDLTSRDGPLAYTVGGESGFMAAAFSEWTHAKRKLAQEGALIAEAMSDRLALLIRSKKSLRRARAVAAFVRERVEELSEPDPA